jgi:hypothetical protein
MYQNMFDLPKNVEQMYSDIWFPDLLDSEKWLSSLFSIRLNWNRREQVQLESCEYEPTFKWGGGVWKQLSVFVSPNKVWTRAAFKSRIRPIATRPFPRELRADGEFHIASIFTPYCLCVCAHLMRGEWEPNRLQYTKVASAPLVTIMFYFYSINALWGAGWRCLTFRENGNALYF